MAAAIALVLAAAVPAIVHATDDTATVTITMTGPAIAVDISAAPTGWEIRGVRLNASFSNSFTLSNVGSVTVDTTVAGTDATGPGFEWTLDTEPGDNQYEIEYDIDGPGGQGNVTTDPDDFVDGLAAGQSIDFGLTVKTPSAGDIPLGNESMQATVTIRAIER